MPPAFRRLAWTAAVATYLLIVLGAWVRITGSGMGCGDHWPLCNGRLFPPLDDLATVIEWTHRLVAAVVSILVLALAAYAWLLRHGAGSTEQYAPGQTGYVALGLLILQVLLGAVTVKLELPDWSVVLHLTTAMLLLASLIATALGWRGERPGTAATVAAALGLATLLLGGVTAKIGAAGACVGFPLCNGQLIPEGGALQHVHSTHRLFAYALAAYVVVWAARSRSVGAYVVLGLVLLQVTVAALMVTGGLPQGLRAVHVAVGTAVWGALVVVALRSAPTRSPAQPPHPTFAL